MARSTSTWLTGEPRTRFGLAVVLLAMLVALLAGKFWEESYIAMMHRDSDSLFDDRLMPATTLLHLVDELHRKRQTLVQHLTRPTPGPAAEPHYALGQHDARIEALIREVEKTYLVADETKNLSALRSALVSYREAERGLLERHALGEASAFDGQLERRFDEVRQRLLRLSEVQQRVGSALKQESAATASQMSRLLYFQLGVAFILGLIASALAMSLTVSVRYKRDPNINAH